VTLYAESSAVVSWLLGEPAGLDVRELLGQVEVVVASDLTLVECDRVLIRAVALGEITEGSAADRRAHLSAAAAHWNVLRVGPEVVDRARRPFPKEPIRTLDALHLASAVAARGALPGPEMLSLHSRIRGAAIELGFGVHPRGVEAPVSR
jgi:predicted nucleic acid-binding protein